VPNSQNLIDEELKIKIWGFTPHPKVEHPMYLQLPTWCLVHLEVFALRKLNFESKLILTKNKIDRGGKEKH